MIDDKTASSILYLIKNNLDVSYGLDIGISIIQAPSVLAFLLQKGLCERSEQNLKVTALGEALLQQTPPRVKVTKKKLEPLFGKKILRLLPDQVYIPEKEPK